MHASMCVCVVIGYTLRETPRGPLPWLYYGMPSRSHGHAVQLYMYSVVTMHALP